MAVEEKSTNPCQFSMRETFLRLPAATHGNKDFRRYIPPHNLLLFRSVLIPLFQIIKLQLAHMFTQTQEREFLLYRRTQQRFPMFAKRVHFMVEAYDGDICEHW